MASPVLAVRPVPAVAFGEPTPVAAWRTKPSCGIVSAAHRTIDPDVERFGRERAGVRKGVELTAPHLVMLTHPPSRAA